MVGDELEPTQNAIGTTTLCDCPPDIAYIALVSFHRLAGNQQSSIRVARSPPMKGLHQAFETFIRNDPPVEKNCPLVGPNPQQALRFGCGEFSIGNGDVYTEGDYCHTLRRHTEFLNQLALHLLGVNKDLVRQAVLHPKVSRFSA